MKKKISTDPKFWQVMILGMFLFLFYNFLYGDLLITTVHGINFWDCLFSGEIRSFYAYNLDAELKSGIYYGYYSAYYDFIIYIIFAVWNFPLWVIKEVGSVPYILDHYLSVCWAKSIILPFLFVSLAYLKKICTLVQNDEKYVNRVCFLFLTSSFTVAYLVVIGQYDIITIAFMLMGMYFYMIDKDKLFLLIFAIAVPVKAFALFLFLILLIYKEKNIWKIIAKLICVLIPFVLLRMILPFASQSNISSLLPLLFNNMWPVSYGSMSLFIMCFVILVLFAYIIVPNENVKKRNIEIIYLSFLTFGVFCATTSPFPYWFMYLVPFVFLVISVDEKLHTVNTLLEMLISFFVVVAQMFIYHWVYSSAICLPLNYISPQSRQVSISSVVERVLGTAMYNQYGGLINPICLGIFIAAIIMFACVNNPWKKVNVDRLVCNSQVNTALNVIRILLALFICAVPLACYLLA